MIWRQFILMLTMVFISIGVLIFIYYMSIRSLEEAQLSREADSLKLRAQELDDIFYRGYSLPYIVIENQYLPSFSRIDGGRLPDEYMKSLKPVVKALRRVNLYSSHCFAQAFYFKNSGCFVSTINTHENPDSFFKVFQFTETNPDEILEKLNQSNGTFFLPVQPLNIAGYKRTILTVLVCPHNHSIGVLSFYDEAAILNILGASTWAKGTSVTIVSKEGETLLRYPADSPDASEGDYYDLKADLSKTHASVTLRVSKEELSSNLRGPLTWGVIIFFVTAAVSMIIALILSHVSVFPIQKLLKKHEVDAPDNGFGENELQKLDRMLSSSNLQRTALESQLRDSLLMKSYSSGFVEKEELVFLKEVLFADAQTLRLAILVSDRDPDELKNACGSAGIPIQAWVRVGVRQIIAITNGGDSIVPLFSVLWQQAPDIRVGISLPFNDPEDLRKAIRQAQYALPMESGVNAYSEAASIHRERVYSRLQHERLYQNILSRDSMAATETLRLVIGKVHLVDARETFYNLRFTMICAAEELELGTDFLEIEYNPDRPIKENMAVLMEMLQALFQRYSENQNDVSRHESDELLAWIRDHAFDPQINATKISEEFHIPEKRVYTTVREHMDMSLNDYILSLRMKRAGRLLYSSSLSVGEIGRLVGYEAESTFFRVFKKFYGITPSEYRKKGAL